MTATDLGTRSVAFVRSLTMMLVIAIVVPCSLASASAWRFGGRLPLHGVPGPSDWRVDRIMSGLTDQLSEQTIADIVVRLSLVIAWSAVAAFLATVAAELVHMVRHGGHHLPDVRGLGWSQRGARTIAAGLLALLPMLQTPGQLFAGESVVLVRSARNAPEPVGPSFGVSPTDSSISAAPVAIPAGYVVRAGDSVYGIAERLAGPDVVAIARLADRIVDLNIGHDMGNGDRFTNAGYIDVGWVLQIPDDSAVVDPRFSPEGGVQHIVEVGESLWSIADDELGDASLWPEIYGANVGRVFDDGRTLDDPSSLRPGWNLYVPAGPNADVDASAEAPSAIDTGGDEVAQAPQPVTHDAHHNDSWHDSPDDVPDSRTDSTLVDVLPDSSAVAATAVEIGAAGRVNEWSVASELPSAGSAVAIEPTLAESDAVGDSASPDLLTLRRAAMLSGGVLTLLAVRRRRRLREAEPRARLPEPASRLESQERALQLACAGEPLARVDLAVRSAAMSLIAARQRVLAVLCSVSGEIELVATGPATLPSVWHGSDDRWILPSSVPIEMLATDARQVAAPCPTLVQLGVDEHGRAVYVDLEAIEALEVGGDESQAEAIVSAIAATLASSVLAEVTTLVSVGVPVDAFLRHRLHSATDDSTAAFDVARRATRSMQTMDASTFELRARVTSGEQWEPAVVLFGSGIGHVELPSRRSGMAVVSASPIHGPSSRLAPESDTWVLRPAGLRFVPIGLVPDDISAISDLVDVARPVLDLAHDLEGHAEQADDDHTIYTPDDDVVDDDARDMAETTCESSQPLPQVEPSQLDWDLLVRVLGPVEVLDHEGSRVSFERSKTRELVAWLATHRDRATRSNARTALWEQDVRDATFANVVSEARRSLARLVSPPDGDEWVGRTLTDALPLHERVRTDAELLEHALAVARLQPPNAAIATLRPAVDSIAGLPFEGTSYLWPDAEGLTSHLILLATSAAAELAAHCLSIGDIEGVFRATGHGLRVLPGHEELIGLRMRAHARAGDHAGVRQEWNSYERVINADSWSDGEPSPKLVGLRKELLNPSL